MYTTVCIAQYVDILLNARTYISCEILCISTTFAVIEVFTQQLQETHRHCCDGGDAYNNAIEWSIFVTTAHQPLTISSSKALGKAFTAT